MRTVRKPGRMILKPHYRVQEYKPEIYLPYIRNQHLRLLKNNK